jgi:hypothetical protein
VPRPIRLLPRLLLLLGLAACDPTQDAAPRTLQFVKFMPERTVGVFLNEPLTFHFSAEVDPLSVHSGSVVVETKSGERAHGSLRVEGKRVVFQPDVPRERDLSDGGYRPGTQYFVRLEGFPRPDGIRGVGGEPLGATVQASFDTVQVDEPRRVLLFDDPHLERRKPPEIFPFAGPTGVYQVGVGDSIYLACEKAIDPTSIRSEDFFLRMGTSSNPVSHDVNLFVRLLENEPEAELRARPSGIHSSYGEEAWRSGKRAALIELTPDGPLVPNEIGNLQYVPAGGDEAWSMRDFSLRPLLPQSFAFRECKISVVVGASPTSSELVEDFVDRDRSSPLTVPGSDGSASWEGDGRIGLHYPLAAGDGSAGSVALGSTQGLGDLQAVDIDLEPALDCRLPDQAGLVVLRAQGRITLRGKLERHAPPAQPLDCDAERGQTLSNWLARAQAANPSCTVLIAGGDIVITGKLESSVPVLLVAGGQIRAAGLESVPGIWTQAGAGGAHSPLLHQAEFLLDPPLAGHNPLKRPLRYAVVSVPLPANGRVARWISALASGGLEPTDSRPAAEHTPSSWSVRYFCADDPQVPDFSKGYTSPVFLERPGAVRFVVELVVGDAPDSWQTPFVDRVQLSFERAR